MPFRLHLPMWFFLLIATFPIVSTAQTSGGSTPATLGEIRIHVQDPSGRAVQAHGILAGPSGGRSRSVEGASDGSLVISDLSVGRYRLQLTHAGFATANIDLQVQSAKPVSRQITLRVGGPDTTVTVNCPDAHRGARYPSFRRASAYPSG